MDYNGMSPKQDAPRPVASRGIGGPMGAALQQEKSYYAEREELNRANQSQPGPPNATSQGLDVMIAVNLDAARSVYMRARMLRDRLAGTESIEDPSIVAPTLGGPTKDSLQAAEYYHLEAARIIESVHLYLFS